MADNEKITRFDLNEELDYITVNTDELTQYYDNADIANNNDVYISYSMNSKKVNIDVEDNDDIDDNDNEYAGNYKLIDYKKLNKIFNEHKECYEVINEQSLIHPYFDIDFDELSEKDVIRKINMIIRVLRQVDYTICGYSRYDINDFEWLEHKTYKALSLHIVIYSITMFHAYNFKKHMEKAFIPLFNIADTSVYKDNGKQQKIRFGFCNKRKLNTITNEWITQDKGVSKWMDKNNDNYNIHDVPPSTPAEMMKVLITNKFDNIEDVQVVRGYDEDNKRYNEVDDIKDINYNGYGDAVLLSLEQLNELINECIPVASYTSLYSKLNDNIADIRRFILHCPYRLNDIKNILIDWYKSKQHDNGITPFIEYINENYQYQPNNYNWLYILLKPLNKRWDINKVNDWSNELEEELTKLMSKKSNQLSKQQRNKRNELTEQKQASKDNFKKSLTADDKRAITLYKKWIKIFNNKRFIIEPCGDDFKKNLFVSVEGDLYIKDKIYGYKSTSRDKILNRIGNTDFIDKLPVIDLQTMDIIMKYGNIILNDDDYKKADKALRLYANGFKEYDDYIYYCRWLAMKLRNPYKSLPRSLVQLEGSGSFKTNFIKTFDDFMKISTIDLEKDLTSQYNEYMTANIIVIDEVKTASGKSAQSLQNTLKQMTSDKTTKLRIKYEKNGKDIKLFSNIIINSNYKSCGGIFNNQTKDNEMFRRFKIIQKQTMKTEDSTRLYKLLNDNRVIYALYQRLITDFKDMTFDEFNVKNAFELEYVNYVKDTSYNKQVMTIEQLEACISKYGKSSCLSIARIVSYLKQYDVITTASEEKQRLLDENIIEVRNNRNYIVSIDKLKDYYIDANLLADIIDNVNDANNEL